MSSIGEKFGFYWETLWNLPENADLKNTRKNPNVLMAGDKVTIPDLRTKDETRQDGAKYKFMRKGVPEKLRLKLLDSDKKPRANVAYKFFIDGNPRTGKTSAEGEIIQAIPPDAQEGQAGPDGDDAHPIMLNLGYLNPIATISGFKSRLSNLGYYSGPMDETWDDAAKAAMNSFQKDNQLPLTDTIDDATRSKLQSTHGH